uniref:DnaJ subfamily C member 2 n=1 Tax=Anthurium amnicola TaxID=1678845 RepID=A0A1D1Y2L6_9ARAE
MGKRTLLISYSSELADGQPIVIASNCLPVKASNLEPAGHAFHSAVLKLFGVCEEDDGDTDDQSVSSDDRSQGYMPFSDSYSSKGRKKSGATSTQQDHYALLGLGHLRFLATEEQIRKCYREAALKHHPDKQAALLLAEETEEAKQAKKDEIENHFKSIQEAYEVLIDPVKRRIYDSTDEFDDDIPTDCAPQDFFRVFGSAFMRNGRWSVNQPVPSLGEDNTPLAEVDSFYNFWYCFKSWREFPHADDFDLEQAESREHKRWMERQNGKLREKARREEHTRIRILVDNAYKKDPRILRRKEEEKAAKQRKKEAKFIAKKLQEEEAARIAEEERCRKEEDDRRAAEVALSQKKLKEKEKKLIRKERNRLRALSTPLITGSKFDISENDVENLCMSLEIEQLSQLCHEMEGKEGTARVQRLKDALSGFDSNSTKQGDDGMKTNGCLDADAEINDVSEPAKPECPLSAYEKKERLWGKEEIEILRKGIQKYPKGTSRRWEVIAEYMNTGRSVEEILKASKTVLLKKPDSAKAFNSFLEKRKPAQAISSPLTSRLESEGTPVGTKVVVTSDTTEKRPAVSDSSQNKDSGSVPVQNGVPSATEPDTWSAAQERALIQALKTFPKETSQRWERIAAAIPGKTVNQCKKKFALMRENFRSKKSAD